MHLWRVLRNLVQNLNKYGYMSYPADFRAEDSGESFTCRLLPVGKFPSVHSSISDGNYLNGHFPTEIVLDPYLRSNASQVDVCFPYSDVFSTMYNHYISYSKRCNTCT